MKERDKPEWLSQGIVFNSVQEPLSFMIRRGAQDGGQVREDIEEDWEEKRSEEEIRRLVESGGNLTIANAHKCFGFETEKEDIESAVRYSKRCKEQGIKVGTYIGETLGYETLFQEIPEAENWVARRYDGKRIYWLGQTFRLVPCKFHLGWIEFQKRVVELAINRIGADFLHFDNVYVWPEPDSCQCENCRGKFREFLRRKYTPQQLKRRLGFSSLDGIVPPPFAVEGRGPDPKRLERINDPLQQEWLDFRCDEVARMYGELCDYARELKPDIALECNPVNTALNTAYLRGVDIPRVVRHGHYFWVEDGNGARVEADGRMISHIRTFKIARTLDNGAFSYTADSDPRLTCLRTAEAMAFNLDCIGPIPGPKGHPASAYVQFYREHRELYAGTRTLADVAVLRSFKSLAWDNVSTHLSVLLAEQTLIQSRIPFHIIFDGQMEAPVPYPVLVLANVQFMSDDEAGRAADYVRKGGAVLITDDTGLYDEISRRRRSSVLLDILGVSDLSTAVRGSLGDGRFAYLPAILPKAPLPEYRDYRQVDNRYWHLPENAAELVESVSWCLGRRFKLEMTGNQYVATELAVSADERSLLVHAVNYDVSRPAGSIEVSVETPSGRNAVDVTVLDPATGSAAQVPLAQNDGRAEFEIPGLDIYAVAKVSLD